MSPLFVCSSKLTPVLNKLVTRNRPMGGRARLHRTDRIRRSGRTLCQQPTRTGHLSGNLTLSETVFVATLATVAIVATVVNVAIVATVVNVAIVATVVNVNSSSNRTSPARSTAVRHLQFTSSVWISRTSFSSQSAKSIIRWARNTTLSIKSRSCHRGIAIRLS